MELTKQFAFLHSTVNLATPAREVMFPETILDNALCENEFVPGKAILLFISPYGNKYVAAVTFKELLSITTSGMLDSLLTLDEEISISTMYRVLGKGTAHKIISSFRRYYNLSQINLRNLLRRAMKEDEEVDSGKVQLANEADEALKRITSENLQFGYANTTILCFGDTQEHCERVVEKVARELGNSRLSAILETTNASAAFASTLPGQWREQERLHLISTPNMSDIAPLRTTWPGDDQNDWLSKQSGEPQYALTVLPSRFKTLTKVNFHVTGGSGNLMTIGPTGGGKSVWLNFLTYQTDRYRPRRYTFDRERSCRIPTLLNGGRFIDVTGIYETATKANPLCLLKDRRHIPFVTNWIIYAIESYGGYECSATDITEISTKVTLFAGYSPDRYRLLNFAGLLPQHLKDQLAPWVEGGKDARFFDHVEDAFELTDEVCIEMGDLMDNHPQACALAIDYFFYRIYDSLKDEDPRPTYIKVEEGSFFLTHPVFSEKLKAASVTLRKRNASIWLATQSLEQIRTAPGFRILHENFKNKIYLPNESASENLYMDIFGLTRTQFDAIKNGTPNKDYLWVTADVSRLFEARFPPEIIAVTRSDERAQNIFDSFFSRREPGWEKAYVNAMILEGKK
nr:type IV secretion system protein VirB4 [Undibacterium oligocarboniphilum]